MKVAEQGGNKHFWDFMKQYNTESKDVIAKYTSKAAKYYARKLAAQIQGKEFNEAAPAKNMEEAFDRGKDTAVVYAKKAEEGLISFGSALNSKIAESGIKEKFKGWFKKE